MPKSHTFTVIMDTYYRPAMLKEAVEALFRQTYDNLEIILVNNGATEETVEYLHQVEAIDKRVKLVHFQENQFSWDDPGLVVNCWNAALEVATGDYIWYQADDDLIADDYAGKMVALFQGNSDCTTAAGVMVAMDSSGTVIDQRPRSSDFRPRYMPGHLLALDILRGGKVLFNPTGTVFTIRRDVHVKMGGYHRSILLSHHYGMVPFGVTGFDETAHFYWRRHDGQLGNMAATKGWIGIDEERALLKEWEIEKRWQVFGADVAKEVVSTLEYRNRQRAADWFVLNLGAWRFSACLRIFRRMWYCGSFWSAVLGRSRDLVVGPIWHFARLPVRWVFQLLPGMVNLSPRLATLKDRANGQGRTQSL